MKQLEENVVVWIARLSESNDALPFLEPLLDDRERERAGRFHFSKDRARFTLGRALARKCLGHFLSRPPESIALTLTDRGRPVLPQGELAFNLSHAGDFVAVAVTENARVGIDLESMQRDVHLIELAERILFASDFNASRHCPGRKDSRRFSAPGRGRKLISRHGVKGSPKGCSRSPSHSRRRRSAPSPTRATKPVH